MREIRQSGSEGGGTSVLPTPITSPGRTVPCGRLLARRGRKPWVAGVMVVRALKARPSAPESVLGWRGASPLQAYALRPVTNCYCAAARRGEELQGVNFQSVG